MKQRNSYRARRVDNPQVRYWLLLWDDRNITPPIAIVVVKSVEILFVT